MLRPLLLPWSALLTTFATSLVCWLWILTPPSSACSPLRHTVCVSSLCERPAGISIGAKNHQPKPLIYSVCNSAAEPRRAPDLTGLAWPGSHFPEINSVPQDMSGSTAGHGLSVFVLRLHQNSLGLHAVLITSAASVWPKPPYLD